jgi:hypothetical protein
MRAPLGEVDRRTVTGRGETNGEKPPSKKMIAAVGSGAPVKEQADQAALGGGVSANGRLKTYSQASHRRYTTGGLPDWPTIRVRSLAHFGQIGRFSVSRRAFVSMGMRPMGRKRRSAAGRGGSADFTVPQASDVFRCGQANHEFVIYRTTRRARSRNIQGRRQSPGVDQSKLRARLLGDRLPSCRAT